MIAVIGLGFVGLTTALGFCSKGYKVYGVDVDEQKVAKLKSGSVPFYEPGLAGALDQYQHKSFFITSIKEAIENSEVVFFCVGTPNDDLGNVDLSYLHSSVRQAIEHVHEGERKVFVVKSTVPPSSTQDTVKPIISQQNIGLAVNPEFLREGIAWEDFVNPDRVVLGVDSDEVFDVLHKLYKPFDAEIERVSFNTAEFIKYFSNSFLANLISFSNEMSMVASTIGDIDIPKAFKTFHKDRRWSGNPAGMTSYVYPGCGFGGYCLPKDTQGIYSTAKSKGYESQLLKGILATNHKVKDFVLQEVNNFFDKEEYIGILGLSFKPGSDDVRATPARDIIEKLLGDGYNKIIAYDPVSMEHFKDLYGFPIKYASSIEQILDKVQNVLVLTAWDEFRENKTALLGKQVLDFRYYIDLP